MGDHVRHSVGGVAATFLRSSCAPRWRQARAGVMVEISIHGAVKMLVVMLVALPGPPALQLVTAPPAPQAPEGAQTVVRAAIARNRVTRAAHQVIVARELRAWPSRAGRPSVHPSAHRMRNACLDAAHRYPMAEELVARRPIAVAGALRRSVKRVRRRPIAAQMPLERDTAWCVWNTSVPLYARAARSACPGVAVRCNQGRGHVTQMMGRCIAYRKPLFNVRRESGSPLGAHVVIGLIGSTVRPARRRESAERGQWRIALIAATSRTSVEEKVGRSL
jgi:hypothetical protein